MTPEPTASNSVPVCYRHAERETYIRCSRCERPICPDCMVPASVGFQCPECVRQGSKQTRPARTVFGGRPTDDPGYVSKLLLGINVVMFLLQQLLPASFTHQLWLIAGPVRDPVLGEALVGVADGEWWRLGTAAFLHGSIFHILFNMYALWLFGPQLEAAFGRARFVALYVLSALGGSAASYAFSSFLTPSLGASGAIFGLFGAYIIVGRKLGRDISALLVLLGINVVLGFTIANIDWRAHAGGLVTGVLVALILVNAPRPRRSLVQAAGCAAVAVAVLAAVTVRTAQLTDTSPATVLSCAVTAPADPQEDFLGCVLRSEGVLPSLPHGGRARSPLGAEPAAYHGR